MSDQMTFTEEDVNNLVDFYNLIVNKSEFTFTAQEAVKFSRLAVLFKQHMDKVNSHILEVKKVIQSPEKKVKK
jgi:hypothetical protein